MPEGYGATQSGYAAESLAQSLMNVWSRRQARDANTNAQELLHAQRLWNTAYNEWLARSTETRWDMVERSYEAFADNFQNNVATEDDLFTDAETRGVFDDWLGQEISGKRVPVAQSAAQSRLEYNTGLMQDNIEAAISAGDLEGLVTSVRAGVAEQLIIDYEADDVISAGAYAINLARAKSAVYAFAQENGYDAAMSELDALSPENFQFVTGYDENGNPQVSTLSHEDIQTIKEEIRDGLRIARSEEEYQINQRDILWQNNAEGIETQAQRGEMSWGQAVTWVQDNATNFKPETYRNLITRFTNQMDEPAAEDSVYAPDADMINAYEDIYLQIRQEGDFNTIEDRIAALSRPDPDTGLVYLNSSMKSTLRGLNSNRERTSDPTEQMIDRALAAYPDISSDYAALIRNRAREQLAQLSVNPDGTYNPGAVTDQKVREIIAHMADPIRRNRTSNVVMESLSRGWLGQTLANAGIQPGRVEPVEQQRMELWAGMHTGTIDITNQIQALSAGITDPDVLRQMFTGGRTVLSEQERTMIDNNVMFAQMYAGDAALYSEYFGRSPRISSSANGQDSEAWIDAQTGALYFKTPDGEFVTLKQHDPVRDERWYVWTGDGWVYSERLNAQIEQQAATPDIGTGPGDVIATEIRTNIEEDREQVERGGRSVPYMDAAATAAGSPESTVAELGEGLLAELDAIVPTTAEEFGQLPLQDQLDINEALTRLHAARRLSAEEAQKIRDLIDRLRGNQ